MAQKHVDPDPDSEHCLCPVSQSRNSCLGLIGRRESYRKNIAINS